MINFRQRPLNSIELNGLYTIFVEGIIERQLSLTELQIHPYLVLEVLF